MVGDTVNTSSRMCTTIKEPMKIRASESTFQLINNTPFLSFIEDWVEAKGKGWMKTYFVQVEDI